MTEETTVGQDYPKSAPEDRATGGPFDDSEANVVRPYVDLGGLLVLPREGLTMRLEIEEQTDRVIAVTLVFGGSTLQVQPFAASRSSGLWGEIREQIRQQLSSQGAHLSTREGPFGPELLASVPIADAGAPRQTMRFIGVDGPRWFLRGVISGAAVSDADAAEQIENLFRSIVVVRGRTPMPPRDLIPMRKPASTA